MSGRLEHKMRNEKYIATMLVELPDCVTAYYNSRTSKESKGSMEYIKKIRHFLRSINEDTLKVEIENITENDVAMYLRSIEKRCDKSGELKETSFAYRRQVYSILFSFFEYLRKRAIIPANPMDCIDRPKAVDNVIKPQLDEFDFRMIDERIEYGAGTERQKNYQKKWKERDRVILLLLMNTGMRKTALSEINVSEVDFIQGAITIIDKNHKTHTYPINSVVKQALSSWIDKRAEILGDIQTDALFISNRKQRISENALSEIVIKFTRASLGCHVTPHNLRAAFCTILYNRTQDIEKVRDAVGHSVVSTTQRYIVNGNQAKEEAAYVMDDIFG